MENSGGERQVDFTTDMSGSPLRLLNLLITRLTEPAAVLDESLTVRATNDAFGVLAGADCVGDELTAVVPALTSDAVGRSADAGDDYLTVRTGKAPERWTEFAFDRHGPHLLCIGRGVDPDRQIGAASDESTLTNLQAATRELLAAETEAAVAEQLVETATGVLGLSGATLYLFDTCRNVLCPTGIAGDAGADAREVVAGDDDSVVREVFLEGAATTVDGGDRYQPLGDYGVFHTVAGDDQTPEPGEEPQTGQRQRRPQPGDRAMELVDLLAESARAALERVDREAMLRERDESHREQAERVTELEQLLSVVRRVHGVLADADSVADVEQGVCAALTASSWLAFTWVGRTDGDRIEPQARAGRDVDYLETVSLSTGDPDAPLAVQTAASSQVMSVDNVADGIREHDWRRAAIARDFQAAISVPLRIDGVSYGVLELYANRPVEWDESLTAVVSELATSVAVAIRDRERRARLAAGTGVELDLSVTAPDRPLGKLSTALGATVCCTEVIPVDGTTTRLFFSVPGGDDAVVADAADGTSHVDSLVAVDEDRYEALVREPTVVGRVVRHGGRLDTACAADRELTLTVTLAADADVRTFVDRLEAGCEHVQLTARRHRSSAGRQRGGIRESLEAVLTDRQLEALRTAYSSGFFEWPRETTGQGVADMLGVAQPTVNRHLRVSQRKLLELVFDHE